MSGVLSNELPLMDEALSVPQSGSAFRTYIGDVEKGT